MATYEMLLTCEAGSARLVTTRNGYFGRVVTDDIRTAVDDRDPRNDESVLGLVSNTYDRSIIGGVCNIPNRKESAKVSSINGGLQPWISMIPDGTFSLGFSLMTGSSFYASRGIWGLGTSEWHFKYALRFERNERTDAEHVAFGEVG